ncbi:MAG: prepilin-type N-terminal cleavage/methylation domain-containing protein [Candidatus Gracilibacteria bacterium]
MSFRPSFTLIEITVAITLFAILATAGVVMVSNVSNAARKVEMEEYLYTEAQNLLEKIAREIQASGIDYEEYYSRNVIQVSVDPITAKTFGENYGEYHKQFFNPGSDDDYGALCVGGSISYPDPLGSGCSPNTSTFDYDTGMNPYNGSLSNPDTANAFCEGSSDCSSENSYYKTNELFLINKSGTERTYFILHNGTVPSINTVKLTGTDTDGNGLVDAWHCSDEYMCTFDSYGNQLPDPADLTKGNDDNEDFKSISPQTLYIDELTFYITPLEDPFKGYAESSTTSGGTFESVQLQPRVTIVLKAHYQTFSADGITPIDFSEAGHLLGQAPTLTLQTTVGTGVTNVIPAYTSP